jgi:hypothetical protein
MAGSIEIWCLVAFSCLCIASGVGMLIQRCAMTERYFANEDELAEGIEGRSRGVRSQLDGFG